MAKPVVATPVLAGQDLQRLIRDVQRPDKGEALRERASQSLCKVMDRGKDYIPRHI